MPTYIVSVYVANRAYGGPEEGGWWYDCGEPCTELIEHMFITQNIQDAQNRKNKLTSFLNDNYNTSYAQDLNSVCCTGRYIAVIDEDTIPAAYPKERPRFE